MRRFEWERSDSISEYRSSPFIPETSGEWAIEAPPMNMISSETASNGP
jgi:hypothetical protein